MNLIFKLRILAIIFYCGFITACSGVGNILGSNEVLDWKVHREYVFVSSKRNGWKGVNGDETINSYYVKNGQTTDNWTGRASTIQWPIAITHTGKMHWTPESVFNALKKEKEEINCSTDSMIILNQDKTSILYEWKDIQCLGMLDQHEITRIVMGRWYLWIIYYGVRNTTLPDERRSELIANLKKASVVLSADNSH